MVTKDLSLTKVALKGIVQINNWLEKKVNKKDITKQKSVFISLFYGQGKQTSNKVATLLGKAHHREVYRIDLWQIVSKYIGETEKNLEKVFEKVENKDWILFFDEADALFGKRTQIRDAHDKYANQEVSYLLQKVQTYQGLIIFRFNNKSTISEHILNKFDMIIRFPKEEVIIKS